MSTIFPKFRVALVLGGARSGKSRYALETAGNVAGRGPDWDTREVRLDLPELLAQPSGGYGVILVDCLTMWLSNLMHREKTEPAAVKPEGGRLARVLARAATPTILVSNEVGWGIVPDNPLAREFRDQAGWLHQKVAEVADLVVLVVAGLPVVVKVSSEQ